MNYLKKKYIIPAIVVIIIILLWVFLGGSSDKPHDFFVKPVTGPFQVNVTTNGELRAKNSTKIRAPSEAMRKADVYRTTITKMVPEGTVVKKGQFVAQLDLSDVSSELKEAKTELRTRKANLKKAKLDSSQALSKARNNIKNLKFAVQQAQLDVKLSKYESPAVQKKKEFNLRKAKRQLKNAKESYKITVIEQKSNIQNLERKVQRKEDETASIKKLRSKFTITAPQNGMVIYARRGFSNSKVTEGDQVSAGRRSVVAELPDFSVMQSITYVNEVDIQKIRKGEKVDITLDAYPDKDLTGVVTSIANIGEQRPGSSAKVFKVVVQVNQSASYLRPSMTTRNVIHTAYVDSVLSIPLATIHAYHDSLNVVYKHHHGKPVMQQVLLGLINANYAIVKAGVGADDQLYLSMPGDTTNINRVFLPDKVVQKYKKQQKQSRKNQSEKKKSQREKMMRRMRMMKDKGQFQQKGKKPAQPQSQPQPQPQPNKKVKSTQSANPTDK